MSTEWTKRPPPSAGWCVASTMRDANARRYWSGTAWSAPVYIDDPRENWVAARRTPADPELAADIEWLDGTDRGITPPGFDV